MIGKLLHPGLLMCAGRMLSRPGGSAYLARPGTHAAWPGSLVSALLGLIRLRSL